MERIERKPVEITIRRCAYDVVFSVTATGIEPDWVGSLPQNVAELKHVMRGIYDLLDAQEEERAKLIQSLEGILNTKGLPDVVLDPAREELARWKEPSDAPPATTE